MKFKKTGWLAAGSNEGTIITVVLGLRVILSAWTAAVWWLVDRYFPVNDLGLREWYGQLPRHESLMGRMLLDAWVRWDAVHFLNIAQEGYRGVGLADMNYFPLYAWITGVFSRLSGEVVFSGLFVSTIAVLVASVFFYQLIRERLDDSQLAKETVLLWLVYPTGFFLFAPYTDALFFCLVMGFFLALHRKKWGWAGLSAALAGLTRAQGILLLLPLVFVIYRDNIRKEKKIPGSALIAVLLAPLGWLGFTIWRRVRLGSNLSETFALYSSVQFGNPFSTMLRAFRQAFETGSFLVWSEILSLLLFAAVLIWMLTRKDFQKQIDWMGYALATLGLYLCKYSTAASTYQSANRYVLHLFPVFIGIAALLQNAPHWARTLVKSVSWIGLLSALSLYTLWIFVG
jgi:hypothetical protein